MLGAYDEELLAWFEKRLNVNAVLIVRENDKIFIFEVSPRLNGESGNTLLSTLQRYRESV